MQSGSGSGAFTAWRGKGEVLSCGDDICWILLTTTYVNIGIPSVETYCIALKWIQSKTPSTSQQRFSWPDLA